MKTLKPLLISLVVLSLTTTGCSFGFMTAEISSVLMEPQSITGSVGSGNGSLSLTAAGCTEVTLYNVNSTGHKTTPIAHTTISSTGEYQISSANLNMTSGRYLLEVLCTSSLYQRFLTGLEQQNLNYGSTLVSWFAHTANAPQISQVDLTQLQSLYQAVEANSSLDNTYTAVSSTLQSAYESTTQTLVVDLMDAAPQVLRVQTPTAYAEDAAASVTAQAFHWSSAYTVFTEWQMDTIHAHTGTNWSFTPTKNHQGARTLNLLIGQEDSGAVDITKPHAALNVAITISNDFPAVVPDLTYSGDAYTNQTALSFDLDTGVLNNGVYSNCDTFTSMTVTEEAYSMVDIPVINPALYTLDCSANPQTVPLNLSGTEGQRHIKVWARDSAGNISATPQKFTVTYDDTDPVINITSPENGITLGRDTQVTVSWNLTEANPGSYTATGSVGGLSETFCSPDTTPCNPIQVSPGVYNMTFTVPDMDMDNAVLEISMTDLAGNTGADTVTFFARAAPNAPVLTLDAAQPILTDSRSIDLDVTYPGDATHIYYSTSSTTPAASAMDWEALATDKTFTLPDTDGNYTIYAWVKNAIAVSSPDSVQVTLDQVAPVLSSVSIENGDADTTNSYVSVRIQGTDLSGVTHYCVLSSTQAPGSGPDSSGCTWTAIANATTLDISPTVYLGDDADQYYVYVWLRDGLGHTSTRAHDDIQYMPPAPATLNNALASTSIGTTYPPALDRLFFDNPSSVFIKWKFEPATGINDTSYDITILHSVDGVDFSEGSPLVTARADQISNCAPSGDFTHCYELPAQAATYHQFKIIAQAGALKTSILTPPLNLSDPSESYRFRILAGNTTLHSGEYALTTPLAPIAFNHAHSLTSDSRGNLYIFDINQGILKYNPGTGVLETVISRAPGGAYPAPGDGPISAATVSDRVSIAVDYEDNLLIWDADQIRKVDFVTNQVTTIIRGSVNNNAGNGYAARTGIAALSYGINGVENAGGHWAGVGLLRKANFNLTPLPNGDLLFKARNFMYANTHQQAGFIARYNSQTQTVDEFRITGSFDGQADTVHKLTQFYFKINPVSGAITRLFAGLATNTITQPGSVNKSLEVDLNTWTIIDAPSAIPFHLVEEMAFVSNPYAEDFLRYNQEQLQRWDTGTSTWVRIAGTGTVGTCDDTIAALSCDMDIRDVHINQLNQMFIWDGTRIRRLNGTTLTTIVGTSPSTGDDGPAFNSKISTIGTLDVLTEDIGGGQTSTKVAFYENQTFKLREVRFTNNNAPSLHHIAGNQQQGAIQNGDSPLTSPLEINNLFFKPDTGDLYAKSQGVFRLDTTWNMEFLGGSTGPNTNDGEPGASIGSYPDNPLLYLDSTKALSHAFQPSGTWEDTYSGLKLYDAEDNWRQYNIAGGLEDDDDPSSIIDNTGSPFLDFFPYYGHIGPYSWDETSREFLILLETQTDKLFGYPLAGAKPGDYNYAVGATLFTEYPLQSGGKQSFATYRQPITNDFYIFYCDNNGRLYRQALVPGAGPAPAATQLTANTTNFRCNGTLRYDPVRNAVVFPFTQNGIQGVAEVLLDL